MNKLDFSTFQQRLESNTFTLVFFEGKNCEVCHALLPKIQALLAIEFPQTPLEIVNTDENPDIAGQFIVFSLPLMIVFKQGREVMRIGGRNPIYQIREQIKQVIVAQHTDDGNPYESLFSGLGE
jgi:thioredoxin-like negative regulator of GroEL